MWYVCLDFLLSNLYVQLLLLRFSVLLCVQFSPHLFFYKFSVLNQFSVVCIIFYLLIPLENLLFSQLHTDNGATTGLACKQSKPRVEPPTFRFVLLLLLWQNAPHSHPFLYTFCMFFELMNLVHKTIYSKNIYTHILNVSALSTSYWQSYKTSNLSIKSEI